MMRDRSQILECWHFPLTTLHFYSLLGSHINVNSILALTPAHYVLTFLTDEVIASSLASPTLSSTLSTHTHSHTHTHALPSFLFLPLYLLSLPLPLPSPRMSPLLRYMYGQYKRINQHCGQFGKGLLWGGSPCYTQVPYCTVLYCTGLDWTGLNCTVLYCTALYCTVLYKYEH